MVADAGRSCPGFREFINLAAVFVFIFGGVTSLTIRPSRITVGENQNAFFNCQADPGDSQNLITTSFNGMLIDNSDPRLISATGVPTNVSYTFGPVTRLDDKMVFKCTNGVPTQSEASATLDVLFPPSYTLPNGQTLSPAVLEGTSSYTYQFTLDANPEPSQFTWTKDGQTLNSSDDRVALTVNSVTISEVGRGDSGTYVVSSMNGGGQASTNFTLDVRYPPEFTFPTVRSVQLNSGSQFTFNCTASAANPSSVDYSFRKDGISQPLNVSGSVLTISSVVRADTGNYSCTANNTAGSATLYHNLLVVAPPQYSLKASQSTAPLEGSTSFTYQFNLDNGGVQPSSFTWSRAVTGDLMNGNKYTLTADSITVKNVSRDDSGSFTVRATNMAGSDSISFTLDVQYPPSLMNINTSSRTLTSGQDELTIDCTPTPGNPPSTNVTSVDSIGVNQSDSSVSISNNSNVLTISPVQRRHRGAYSCTASNGVGQDPSVTVQVDVFGPPTAPRSVAVSGEMSFSATVMWTAPEDSGLSSPFSSPSEALTYHISYNSSSSTQNLVNDSLEVVLSNLQHSTNYTVSVEASNVHGTSPASNEVHFRTPDSKPILQAVVLAPLSLNNFTANVTFLTVGGQNVTSFSITINGSSSTVPVDSTPVPDGKGVMVSLLIEGQSFTKGTYYTVEITATNSVGTSEPIAGLMFVPNPPMITTNFTQVSAGSIPSTKCCAGVQLMLAEQPDVSNLKVLLTPQGGNQFTVNPAELSLEVFTLYIGGVQAGTDYTAVVTVSNIFGSSDSQLQLKPLLGVPSNPNPPTVSLGVDGGQVTVELSTAYPGTVQTRSGSMFRFEIQFIEEEQRSSRQSKTEMQPATPASLFNTSAIFTTSLDPGSYSVSVTAVNEHGRSRAVMSQSTFTVRAPTSDITITIIIAIVVVVVVLVLIVLIIAIICVICCMKIKKNKKGKYPVESEDMELTTNSLPAGRNVVEKNSLDGDRNSFMETAIYDEVGKETKKPPKPQSTPAASTTNGQPQPGGDVYAEVNKPKKTDKAAATPTPPTGDVYAAVDMSKKTKKPKMEAPADKVDPEATLYAEVVQEKKEPAVPPKTEAEYQNPEVDKPIEENELQYAALDFSKAPSSFKKPAPPNPDENVIYSEVTIAKKH